MNPPPPPPPPPPHGDTSGNRSGLPPGNYDIFIIPPHSAGSGFLYLPSLQPHRNSFLAGVASTLLAVAIWTIVFPVLKEWFATIVASGGTGVILLLIGVGVAGWAWGKTQLETGGSTTGGSAGGAPSGHPNPGASNTYANANPNHNTSPPPGTAGGMPEPAPGPPPSAAHLATKQHRPHPDRQPDLGQERMGESPGRNAEKGRRAPQSRRAPQEARRRPQAPGGRRERAGEAARTRRPGARGSRAPRESSSSSRRRYQSRRPPPPPSSRPSSPTKKPPPPTAHTAPPSTYSFRPYDTPHPHKPSHKSSASSIYSAASSIPSQSTARTTPPPSVRGPYTTKDPDKIVLKAVYAFTSTFTKLPVAQLVSGAGAVTDGLVLRITTEGLFIDDDVRGVPQREWDVKAWTMRLVESGEYKALHVLRASIRDQDAKRYVFVLQEAEGWKVAVGLQRLRRGTQVRALGVSGMPVNETRAILEGMGWV
ncbi:hypothetical protein MMC32_004297 [Xylographa parallela]|nr:hypothetical protein [Xylographa parallela]